MTDREFAAMAGQLALIYKSAAEGTPFGGDTSGGDPSKWTGRGAGKPATPKPAPRATMTETRPTPKPAPKPMPQMQDIARPRLTPAPKPMPTKPTPAPTIPRPTPTKPTPEPRVNVYGAVVNPTPGYKAREQEWLRRMLEQAKKSGN